MYPTTPDGVAYQLACWSARRCQHFFHMASFSTPLVQSIPIVVVELGVITIPFHQHPMGPGWFKAVQITPLLCKDVQDALGQSSRRVSYLIIILLVGNRSSGSCLPSPTVVFTSSTKNVPSYTLSCCTSRLCTFLLPSLDFSCYLIIVFSPCHRST